MALSPKDIDYIYRVLLDREADSAGLKIYQDFVVKYNISNPFLLSQLIVRSDEFRSLHNFGAATVTEALAPAALQTLIKDIILDATKHEWILDTLKFYEMVKDSGVSESQIEETYKRHAVPADAYYQNHKRRFRELFGWLAWQKRSRSKIQQRLLEIGTSSHTTSLYKPLLGFEFDTVCRPPEMSDGPTREWALGMGSGQHWTIDLNELESGTTLIDEISDESYDFIICCEVVEHLVVDPSVVVRSFLPKLAPDGLLFLSTPNYFRPSFIESVLRGRNPAQDFQEYMNNKHAHHHFREYTPIELSERVTSGGAEVESVVFSNCWSSNPLESPDEAPMRENLVLIAKRPGSPS